MSRRRSKDAAAPVYQEENNDDEMDVDEEEEEEPSSTKTRASRGKGKGKAKAKPKKAAAPAADSDDEENGATEQPEADDAEEEEELDGASQPAPKRKSRTSTTSASAKSKSRRSGGGINLTQSSQPDEPEDAEDEEQFSYTQGEPEKWTATSHIDATQNSVDAAAALTNAEQSTLIKSLARLLLMKGSRQAAILRKDCSAELAKNNAKRTAVDHMVAQAGTLLFNTFGYQVSKTPSTKSDKRPWHKPDSFYLTNALKVPAHTKVVLNDSETAATRGLLMLTLGLIYCQPSKTMAEDALLASLHALDERIPLYDDCGGSAIKGKGRGSSKKKDGQHNTPGLGNVLDVLKLLENQQYLACSLKQDYNADGDQMKEYTMGTRSYMEIGRRALITFLSETLGQPVDPAAFEDVTDDEDDENASGDEEQ